MSNFGCDCTRLFHIAKEIAPLKDMIVKYMAFNPPKKSINKSFFDVKGTYEIFEKSEKNNNFGLCSKEIKFIHKDYKDIKFNWLKINCYKVLKFSNKKNIIVLHVINKKYFNIF